MLILKNETHTKDIFLFKELITSLKGMGGDVTPPPIHSEEANAIRSHKALKGTPIQETRGLPFMSHMPSYTISLYFNSNPCETMDSCGKFQAYLKGTISSGLVGIIVYTGITLYSPVITLNSPAISSLYYMEPPYLKWQSTLNSYKEFRQGWQLWDDWYMATFAT
jgi:hypothetical protein